MNATLLLSLAVSMATPTPTMLPTTNLGKRPALELVVLGAGGGVFESDLSSYLLTTPTGGAVLLDAGSVLAGAEVAARMGALPLAAAPKNSPVAAPRLVALQTLREDVRAVFLSHAHLDHTAGLIIASPDDAAHPVFGLAPTLDALTQDTFNWRTWGNFTDRGPAPQLRKYQLQTLEPGVSQPVNAAMSVTAFPLAHAGGTSTAFVFEAGPAGVVAYLGDTGPDAVEQSHRLQDVWRALAPHVRSGRLRALLIECSYPDGRPDQQLFGHLTPAHLLRELEALRQTVDANNKDALVGLRVLVVHVKPDPRAAVDVKTTIRSQLQASPLGVKWLLPSQGDRLTLD